jgi:hypothetical protein
VATSQYDLTLVHESKWDTDSWRVRPPDQIVPGQVYRNGWEVWGGAFRGCHASVRYEYRVPGNPDPLGYVVFSETKHWNGAFERTCHFGGVLRCVEDETINSADNPWIPFVADERFLKVRWSVYPA